jgi:hypothetical protein
MSSKYETNCTPKALSIRNTAVMGGMTQAFDTREY